MIPGQVTHAPPAGPSPLAGVFKRQAQAAAPARGRGPAPQAPGAPMPLNAGGHASAKFGHAAAVMPG